jgi:hypothetical protein
MNTRIATFGVLLALWGCGSQPSAAVFATSGTGTWRALPPIPTPYDGDGGGSGNLVEGAFRQSLFSNGGDVLAPVTFALGPAYTTTSGGALSFDLKTNQWGEISAGLFYPPNADGVLLWTGQEVILFGGSGCGGTDGTCSGHGVWNPSTGVVKTMSLVGAPPFGAPSVTLWAGTRMIVLGAILEGESVNDSGTRVLSYTMYDPQTDTWTPMAAPPTPCGGIVVWTGTEMLGWGGSSFLAYDPTHDAWSTLPSVGQPSTSRAGPAAVWTGTEMIIWGGATLLSNPPSGGPYESALLADGAAYNPTTKTWRSISAPNTGLMGPAAVWTGTEMLVWGGSDEYNCGGGADCPGSNLGYRYNPTTDQWQYITTVNAPGPRTGPGAVWTGTSLMIWGGYQALGAATDGAQWFP